MCHVNSRRSRCTSPSEALHVGASSVVLGPPVPDISEIQTHTHTHTQTHTKYAFWYNRFLWRDSNDKLSGSRSLGCLSSGAVSQQFYVGPDHFIIHNVFLSVFRWIYLLRFSLDCVAHWVGEDLGSTSLLIVTHAWVAVWASVVILLIILKQGLLFEHGFLLVKIQYVASTRLHPQSSGFR